jgi:hypothetical protein
MRPFAAHSLLSSSGHPFTECLQRTQEGIALLRS